MFRKSVAKVMVAGLLLVSAALPGFAADKMAPHMGGKMSSMKMSGKMSGHSMSSDKMMAGKMMGMMTPAEKKTYSSMSSAEKALMWKMIHAHAMAMSGGKTMGGSMNGGNKMAMMCPHCNVAMKNGKCPMCGMTMSQMKNHKM